MSFVRWFCHQDLFEKEAKRTSWVIIGTIALMTTGGLLAVGLPLAVKQVNLSRLQANPQALCLCARDRMQGRRFGAAERRVRR